jgi:hypothetical protein
MNKKATIILLSASLAFIIATVILLNGVKTINILGSSQISIFSIQKEGDLYLAYIDNAAKFSLAETIKITPSGSQDFYTLCKNDKPSCAEISQHFGTIFKKHLDSFNTAYNQKLDIKNYKFSSKLTKLDNQPAIEIIGVSTDQIILQKGEDLKYLISPNFKVRADLEELNSLATTTETIAITFFNDVASKFEKCLRQINSGLNNCFCDNSEIETKNLPEEYKISIITTVEREKLFGGVEYNIKLLDKKGNAVASKRGEYIKDLKGILGAYEYTDEDVKRNACYPGAFAKDRTYTFDGLNPVKGRIYLFSTEANCKGVSNFDMVGFIKESDYGKVTGSDCSLIGVKSS